MWFILTCSGDFQNLRLIKSSVMVFSRSLHEIILYQIHEKFGVQNDSKMNDIGNIYIITFNLKLIKKFSCIE